MNAWTANGTQEYVGMAPRKEYVACTTMRMHIVSLVNNFSTVVTCPELAMNISHGNVTTPDGVEYLSQAQYQCEEGYFVDGDAVRTCQGDRSWSTPIPTCTRKFM